MKYEMIFGDEGLADKFTNENSVLIINRGGVYFEFENANAGVNYIVNFCLIGDSYYMRRIIKEPKRWTWEDKKAGKLPEVGTDVLFGKKGKHDIKIAEFIGTGTIECVWCLRLRCGSYVFVESEIVSPIETQAEKAKREEDEFVEELASGVSRYDSFINGARAAYRKLKGSE